MGWSVPKALLAMNRNKLCPPCEPSASILALLMANPTDELSKITAWNIEMRLKDKQKKQEKYKNKRNMPSQPSDGEGQLRDVAAAAAAAA